MSQFTCPSCSGGFPEPEPGDPPTCPWCGAAMDGSGSVLDPPSLPNVDTASSGNDVTLEPADLGQGRGVTPGTVSCPECGDPMPLTAYIGDPPRCQDCASENRMEGPRPIQDGGVE